MGKNKELRKAEDSKALDVQLKALGVVVILVFAGVILRQFHGTVFTILRYSCFAGVAGLFIFLKIYNGRRNKQ